MSKPTLLVALLVLAFATACSGSTTSSASESPTASPSAVAPSCLSGTGARHLSIGPSPALDAWAIGDAHRVVIASDQSDEDLCAWVPFARKLAAGHLEVVLYDYAYGTAPEQLARLVHHARHDGARSVSLLGASEGAKASIIVAAKHPNTVTDVVSLSAEAVLNGVGAVAPYAKRLQVPVLYVTARHDDYGSTQAARRFEKITPALDRQLRTVPGTDHGTALLTHPDVALDVRQFLGSHAG